MQLFLFPFSLTSSHLIRFISLTKVTAAFVLFLLLSSLSIISFCLFTRYGLAVISHTPGKSFFCMLSCFPSRHQVPYVYSVPYIQHNPAFLAPTSRFSVFLEAILHSIIVSGTHSYSEINWRMLFAGFRPIAFTLKGSLPSSVLPPPLLQQVLYKGWTWVIWLIFFYLMQLSFVSNIGIPYLH